MSEDRSMEELLRESQRGDRNAFGDLVSRFRGDLDAFVQSRLSPTLRERLDPEDVVQDTMVRALRFVLSARGSVVSAT